MPDFDLDAALMAGPEQVHLATDPEFPGYAAVWTRQGASPWVLIGSIGQDDGPLWSIRCVYVNGECPRYIERELTTAPPCADPQEAVARLVQLWQSHHGYFEYGAPEADARFRPPA